MDNSEFQLAKLSKVFDDPAVDRKRQKAGREKKRRDQLNEQFSQLGSALDPDRPKNDKTTILSDTIQLLKELTAEVDKLKAEHVALSEESHEEKNDLREEKATLKSDIEILNAQSQQRLGPTYPWATPDSLLSHAPTYPYPMPIAFPPTPIPMHPSLQPYPYFSSPNPGIFQNPCPPYIPYMPPSHPVEQPSTQHISPSSLPGSRTEVSARQTVGNSSEMDKQIDKNEDQNVVATNLELKTPGSTTDEDDTSPGESRSRKPHKNKDISGKGSSSSRYSSHSIQDSSSDSVVGGGNAND